MTEQEYSKRDYQAQMDAYQMDANQQEQEEMNAKKAGYCYHCGEKVDDCSGYKCWK